MGRSSTPADGPKNMLIKNVPADVYNAVRDAAALSGQSMTSWVIDAMKDRTLNATDVMNTSRVAYASSVITSGSSMGSWIGTPTYSALITSVASATSPQVASAIDLLSGKVNANQCAVITSTTAAVDTTTAAAGPITTTGTPQS